MGKRKKEGTAKDRFLQVRVSACQKKEIARIASGSGMSVSEWVLGRCLPRPGERIRSLVHRLAGSSKPSLVLAELSDRLVSMNRSDLALAVEDVASGSLSPLHANIVAAMVELACHRARIPPPGWTASVHPLEQPWFASDLRSLRMHLLTSSPPPFSRRNLFVDSTLGARV